MASQKNFTEQTSLTSSSHITTVSIWILGTPENLRVFHPAPTDFQLIHNLEYSSLNYRWHPNGTRYGETPWQQFGADKIDYELHLQAKLNFLVFYNAKRLRHSELTLLRNDCELERTQFLIIFMLALQNTRLAGYMLIGDRSMFLDTDGSVAWLYQCPTVI